MRPGKVPILAHLFVGLLLVVVVARFAAVEGSSGGGQRQLLALELQARLAPVHPARTALVELIGQRLQAGRQHRGWYLGQEAALQVSRGVLLVQEVWLLLLAGTEVLEVPMLRGVALVVSVLVVLVVLVVHLRLLLLRVHDGPDLPGAGLHCGGAHRKRLVVRTKMQRLHHLGQHFG